MINSFRCRDTERLFSGVCPKRFLSIRHQAERKLALPHAAATIEFLSSQPVNKLEKLSGDRRGSWSIRINQQWRVCFRFAAGNAFDVEIVEHQ